ncbi:serine hydrolase domain-containing protein [Actinomadura hibisca]|uniref:serine hydrolase domain-containing protein n=1 Tax=Actinomadura hibisca TaxID=68565 RepID=UPI000A007E47|nr:serine hydrolase [Actinomadura hibisca]
MSSHLRRATTAALSILLVGVAATVLTATATANANARPTSVAIRATVGALPLPERLPLPLLAHLPFSPTMEVRPAAAPVQLTGKGGVVDTAYTYEGRRSTVQDFLKRSSTAAFIVLRDDQILGEQYFSGYNARSLFNSWSVGKTVTATAVGIALDEGRIASLDDPVTKYVPELKGTGYGNVSVRNVVRMSSGNDWSERNADYFNPTTGIVKASIRMGLGTPMTTLAKETKAAFPPGGKFNYDSMNSYVLAWVLERATGRPMASYLEEKLWKPAGMADTMKFGRDYQGNPLGYCCYFATARDFARFGLLYAREGQAHGRQVVPASWVRDSTRPSAPQFAPGRLYPGEPDAPENAFGYGYGWWLGDGDRGDHLAIGILGEFVYVSPRDRTVILKISEDLNSGNHEGESLAAFRAIADEIARS